MKFKEGDYVKIVARELTAADAKSGLYYQHFSGLQGTVDRIYGEEICINVDPNTLPEGIRKRHTDIQESMRRKWLNGLSGEARHRLTPVERQFNLAYTILVQSTDLAKAKKSDVKPVEIKSLTPVAQDDDFVDDEPADVQAVAEVAEVSAAAPAPEKQAAPAPKVKTAAPKKAEAKAESAPEVGEKLSAAELAFLQEREKSLKGKK